MFVGQDLNNALIHAEDEAKQMGDEYVSVEHIFLSLLKYASRDLKRYFVSLESAGKVFCMHFLLCVETRE